MIFWSSIGTCGFKGTRRGTPFAAQIAAGNAIRTVANQGMQRAEVMITRDRGSMIISFISFVSIYKTCIVYLTKTKQNLKHEY